MVQGIRAMDTSIQTLKDEMNKLMSVYEYVKVNFYFAKIPKPANTLTS